jgi:type I restriction enzyme S subunit
MEKHIIPDGYKQTVVGIIPKEWDVCTGNQLFTKIQDGTHFSPTIRGGEYLYITSKNIKFGYLDIANADYIDEAQHEAIYRRCDVKLNDILLTKDGANTGNVAINNIDEPFSLLSSVAFLRIDNNSHSPEFFLQQILSPDFQSYIKDEMSGNAITRLTLAKINNLKFYVPPRLEQTAIANALSDVDALITGLEKLIAKKQAIKTATMQQLLTGRTRLPEFANHPDGTPKGYKQTELGEIPEDWEVVFVSEYGELLTGFPFSSNKYSTSGIKLLRGSNIKRGQTDWTDELTQYWPKLDLSILQYQLKEGDIVISMDGSLVGRSFAQLNLSDLPALLLQRVARVRAKNAVEQNYLKEWICSKFFTEHCDSVKTTTAIPHISPQDIRDFPFLKPPTVDEQTAIAKILSDMDEEIQSLQQRLAKTRQIKQGMMQELLTGKTRLV